MTAQVRLLNSQSYNCLFLLHKHDALCISNHYFSVELDFRLLIKRFHFKIWPFSSLMVAKWMRQMEIWILTLQLRYEVSSIKNVNPSIKYEGIKLQTKRTTNSQLSQKSFKTCLRKLTIIAPFIYCIHFLKNKKILKLNLKKMKKIRQNNFRNCPKKGVKRDAIYFVNSPKFYEEDVAERPLKKR